MSLFEITIQRKEGDVWPVVVRHQPGSGGPALWSRGRLALDLAALDLLLPSSQAYGLLLGEALFQADIRDAFVRAAAEAKVANESLRVLLIVEAAKLRGLHWEQLHAPLDRGWDYLLLFADDKATLWAWHEVVVERLAALRLTIHPGAHPRSVTEGIPFLGFVVHPERRRLKRHKGIQYRRRFRILVYRYLAGEVPLECVTASVQGWANHARYGNTAGLRKAILSGVTIPIRLTER